MSKPDPAITIDTSKVDEKQARDARKEARLTAWKREPKKADRQAAKKDRIAAWEERHGRPWEEPTWL